MSARRLALCGAIAAVLCVVVPSAGAAAPATVTRGYYECSYRIDGTVTYPAVAWRIRSATRYDYGDGTPGKYTYKARKFRATSGPLKTVSTLVYAKGPKGKGQFTFTVKDTTIARKPFLATCVLTKA